jgi:hypothetical protein
MLNEIFLSLFAVTFLVAVVAFSAYGYLLFTLLKHRSEKFRPDSIPEFIDFLWKLLIYYIQRALSGFFDIKVGQNLDFIKMYDGEIKDVESNSERMISAYRLFSTAYILFFILIVCLILVFIYMVAGPYL